MDDNLYNILVNAGTNDRVPEAGSAFAQALDAAALREAQLQMKHRDEHNAQLDDLANQGMFEQYLRQGTAFEGSPRELGSGALRDRKTLQGEAPRPAAPQMDEAAFDRDYAEAEKNGSLAPPPGAVLRSAFERSQSMGEPGNPAPIEIKGANWVGEPAREKLASRGVNREPQLKKPGSGYAPRRTEEGRKNAQGIRQMAFTAGTSEERLKLGQEYGARKAELQAATQLVVQSMRDSAALQRIIRKGPGKGVDPFKWAKESLDNAQKNLDAARGTLAKLQSGFGSREDVAAAEQAVSIANDAREEARTRYEAEYSKHGGAPAPAKKAPAKGGAVPHRFNADTGQFEPA